MQRKILLFICELFVALGGMSWVGQAEDRKSADIQPDLQWGSHDYPKAVRLP